MKEAEEERCRFCCVICGGVFFQLQGKFKKKFSASCWLTDRCVCVYVEQCAFTSLQPSSLNSASSVSIQTFIHPPVSSFLHTKQKSSLVPSLNLLFSVQYIRANQTFCIVLPCISHTWLWLLLVLPSRVTILAHLWLMRVCFGFVVTVDLGGYLS